MMIREWGGSESEEEEEEEEEEEDKEEEEESSDSPRSSSLDSRLGYLLDWRCYETSNIVDNSEHQLSFSTRSGTSRDTCEGCLKSWTLL